MQCYPTGNKEDWQGQVRSIINKDNNSGSPDCIKALLNWLQDCNWPGANEACDYLIQHCKMAAPYALEILRGNDEVWKYWIINRLVNNWPKEVLYDNLSLIKEIAMKNDKEEVNISAARILCENNLLKYEDYDEILKNIEDGNPGLAGEVNELKKLAQQSM